MLGGFLFYNLIVIILFPLMHHNFFFNIMLLILFLSLQYKMFPQFTKSPSPTSTIKQPYF